MIYDIKKWEFIKELYPDQYIDKIWITHLKITNENYCDTLNQDEAIEYEYLLWLPRHIREARMIYYTINNMDISSDWFKYFRDILETNYIK